MVGLCWFVVACYGSAAWLASTVTVKEVFPWCIVLDGSCHVATWLAWNAFSVDTWLP